MNADLDERMRDEFVECLRTLEPPHKVTITQDVLQEKFAEVFHHRPNTYRRREMLLRCLEHAQQMGIIRLPSAKGSRWDRSGSPALPVQISRVVQLQPKPQRWWATHLWAERLGWVAELDHLTEMEQTFLRRLNQVFLAGGFQGEAPPKYRSIELTGYEKALKKLIDRSKLFQGGRLRRDDLKISSETPPMPYQTIDPGQPSILIFENESPYNLVRKVLAHLPSSPYGYVACGEGTRFKESVRFLAEILGGQLERVEYVGDLDWPGLRIAHDADQTARNQGLPAVEPARGLHQLMLEALRDPRIRQPDGLRDDQAKKERKAFPAALEWLPNEVRSEVGRVLGLGHRVPEEMLTEAALQRYWTS